MNGRSHVHPGLHFAHQSHGTIGTGGAPCSYSQGAPAESIVIDIQEDLDPNTPISELFAGGPIEVRVLSYKASTIRIGIKATNDLNILRSELVE